MTCPVHGEDKCPDWKECERKALHADWKYNRAPILSAKDWEEMAKEEGE